jgi:enoyl-CoA hydratase/carnithine racemase
VNYEQHDNLLLADWTFEGSLLSSAADAEIAQLEALLDQVYELATAHQVEAVLWIQKVAYSDFHFGWLEELTHTLLRDDLRWRLARLYRIRRLIQECPVPWFYLTEKSCLGTLVELMFACHRRFVFETETWFGCPELSIGQLPALGWLATQIQRKQKLLDLWQRQVIWKAEEAVEFGLVDAALSWKDWRLVLLPWAQRQIDGWEQESRAHRRGGASLGKPLHQLWTERAVPVLARSHVQSYLGRTNRRSEAVLGVDAELIDSAAHFMCQPAYEAWLRRGVQQGAKSSQRSTPDLIYLDITESLVPITMVAHLLDAGHRLCFVAEKAELLRQNLELSLSQIEARYRRHPLQMFDKKISWYVGVTPKHPLYPTIRFGSFRDVHFLYQGVHIHGWALTAQSMERQVLEIPESQGTAAPLLDFLFQAVYGVRSPSTWVPLLYLVKSLALQVLLQFGRTTGQALPGLFEQLRGLGWTLLGSERHWQRFLDYRQSLVKQLNLGLPTHLGRLELDPELLLVYQWRSLYEAGQSRKSSPEQKGPGWLHHYLSSFCLELSQELVAAGWIRSSHEADLYVADAMGYPEVWGTPSTFARRMGTRRHFFSDLHEELVQT